jgi:Uma2 family endonuclease
MSVVETTVETPPAAASRLRMSYEEWLDWDHEGGLSEWVDGEVVFYMSPLDEHQRVVAFLDRLLGLFVRLFRLGRVQLAPFVMRIVPGGPGHEPDVFYLSAEHLSRLTRRQLDGPADLVVEVVSDDSVTRDRDEKFSEYQAGGVREYWIIDPRPQRLRADFYVLDARGRYRPVPLGDDDIYHSTVLPNFWLNTNWLWQEDPDPLLALAEIVGAKRVIAALREEG